MEKNRALSVDQCRLQAQVLKFSVHLIDLLSMLLRCNGFAKNEKAVVDQIGSRPPNSDHDLFWHKFGFGKCFGVFFFFLIQPLRWSSQLSCTICFSLNVIFNQEMIHCCVQ